MAARSHATTRGDALASLALGATLAGCSLLVDTDGLSAGAPPGAVDDGGSGRDAALAERDAMTIGDATSDVCAGSHTFCDSFDDGTNDPTTRWDDVQLDGASIAFDTTTAVSAPRSLRFDLSSGTGSRRSTIDKRVPTKQKDVTVTFDIRIDAPSSQDFGAIEYASIVLSPPPPGVTSHAVSLYQYGGAPPGVAYYRTPEDSGNNRAELTPGIAFGVWQRIAFHLVLGDSPKVSVSLNGAPSAVVKVSPVTLEAVEIRLGFDTADARTATTVRYDNVTVDEQP